jgi:hypothetical protein
MPLRSRVIRHTLDFQRLLQRNQPRSKIHAGIAYTYVPLLQVDEGSAPMATLRYLAFTLSLIALAIATVGTSLAEDSDNLGRVKAKFPNEATSETPPNPATAPGVIATPTPTAPAINPPVIDDRSYDQLREPSTGARAPHVNPDSGQVRFGDGRHGRRPAPTSGQEERSSGSEARKDITVELRDQGAATGPFIAAQARAQAGPALRRQGIPDVELEQLARRAATALAAQQGARETRACTREGACLRVIVR